MWYCHSLRPPSLLLLQSFQQHYIGTEPGGSQFLCSLGVTVRKPQAEFVIFSGKRVVVTSYSDHVLWNGICHTYLPSDTNCLRNKDVLVNP